MDRQDVMALSRQWTVPLLTLILPLEKKYSAQSQEKSP